MVQISRRHTRKANGFNSSVHAALATTPERGTQKKVVNVFFYYSLSFFQKTTEKAEEQSAAEGGPKKREKVNDEREGKEKVYKKRKSLQHTHEKNLDFFCRVRGEKIAKGESIVKSLRAHKNNDANRGIFVHRVDVRRLSFKLWHFCHRRCPIVKKLRRGREPNCLRL